jgi:hypothetical protein
MREVPVSVYIIHFCSRLRRARLETVLTTDMQGYLTFKKTNPPRTLPYAFA